MLKVDPISGRWQIRSTWLCIMGITVMPHLHCVRQIALYAFGVIFIYLFFQKSIYLTSNVAPLITDKHVL